MARNDLAAVMVAKAKEHERIQKELRDSQHNAEIDYQCQIANQWIKENAGGLLPKIDAIAIQGGRYFTFALHPDSRYSDCSGAWYTTFAEVKRFFARLGFSVNQLPHCGCASTTVEISW